jgi:MOSC domain
MGDYIAALFMTCYGIAQRENVMPLMTKLAFTGRVDALLMSGDRALGLEKSRTDQLKLRFAGIEGDCHSGLTRPSDSRTLRQYPRDTLIRNVRQLTLLSREELADIATIMAIPEVKPEWVGANLVTSDIPDLTLLPPSSRMQFPSGATIVVDMENQPCRYPAEIIEKHNPDQKVGFVQAAKHKRGITAWVEREGDVALGDEIIIWIPPQRLYGAGAG